LCFMMLFVTYEMANAATCILSGGGVNFGVYNPVATLPTDGAGTVSLQCNWVGPGGAEHVAYVVTLSTGVSGGYAARTMVSGADTLTYNLYVDAARTQVWGNGSGGTAVWSGSFNVSNGRPVQIVTATDYGRIPAGQDAAAGTYSDTITVTVDF
jgi:spore coat protein U-like protein